MGVRIAACSTSAVLALAVLSGCSAAETASPGDRCGRHVIEDWADGRIDRVYPEHCYLAAIATLPEDLRSYTTARDDIARALQSRRPIP